MLSLGGMSLFIDYLVGLGLDAGKDYLINESLEVQELILDKW